MIVSKDNNGKPIGFIETLVSNTEVVVVNATQQTATITTRDRSKNALEINEMQEGNWSLG